MPWGFCRVLCRDVCRVADSLRLVEAMPLSERLGHTPVEAMPFLKRFCHTMLELLEDVAATGFQGLRGGAAGLGWVREHSALGDVRVGSAGVGHAESGAGKGELAACDMPE